ncbi:hypothetical protein J6590_033221, partial [Homalodisca vitripennis]
KVIGKHLQLSSSGVFSSGWLKPLVEPILATAKASIKFEQQNGQEAMHGGQGKNEILRPPQSLQ